MEMMTVKKYLILQMMNQGTNNLIKVLVWNLVERMCHRNEKLQRQKGNII